MFVRAGDLYRAVDFGTCGVCWTIQNIGGKKMSWPKAGLGIGVTFAFLFDVSRFSKYLYQTKLNTDVTWRNKVLIACLASSYGPRQFV